VRFYTHQHHTEPEPGAVTVIRDPRESAERRERAMAQQPSGALLITAEVAA